MSNISDTTLKQAQKIMLDMLIEVDRICQKHNIKYWLDSGTLIGAVRHKGFIPWDDDLDISMTLEDYNKFCKIAQDELPQSMFLQNEKTDKFFPAEFTKIRDNRGTIIEYLEDKIYLSKGKTIKYNQGIFLDIFPIIKVSSSKILKYFYPKYFRLINLFGEEHFNIPVVRNFLITIFDKLHNPSLTNAKYIRSSRFRHPSLYIDEDVIFPIRKIEFENKQFCVPNKYHEYLSCLYGNDYMNLPPIEKRITHAIKIEIFKVVL